MTNVSVHGYTHPYLPLCPDQDRAVFSCPPTDVDMTPPDDPIGTVRAGNGLLAIRAQSANPDWEDDELSWFVIDIGHQDDMQPDDIEAQLGAWPIVYQPDTGQR